jgi:hypothetical protein
MLGEIASTEVARLSEYRGRKGRYVQRTFRKDEAEHAASEGWELVRENQNSLRFQKTKEHDEQLENEFWCLLYNFGYPSLNVGRNFQIEITSNDRTTVSIVEAVHGFVVERLRALYGNGDDDLITGVGNKEIVKKAFEKRVDSDDDKKKDLATYLDFIDLRRIVETSKNWENFKDKLNIPLPDEPTNRSKCVSWFNEINKLRRVSAHPYNRGYDDTEFSTIRYIYDRLRERNVVQNFA